MSPATLATLKQNWKALVVLICVLLFALLGIALSSPSKFPTQHIVTIEKGADLRSLSENLKEEHVIRSAELFRMSVILLSSERGVQAGDYYLPGPQSAVVLAWRMVHAKRDITQVKITIPEGFTTKQISALFDSRFPLFNHAAFEASAPQGYLFPDTYFIQVNATASTTLGIFQDNFHKQVDPLQPEITASGHSIYNIIDVASILQAEAKTPEDMALISGIIWKRLSLDMPLQVDSAPETYKREGLPLSPINNPGLVAIKAAIHPTDSDYLYYISDKADTIHYAKTLAEQNANIEKYLK